VTDGPQAARRGSVAVVGAAGGAGASTVACGLAMAWAARREAVWLVDLDGARGDLAAGWDLPATRTLADLAGVAGEVDRAHLARAASPHPSGVRVVASAGVLAGADPWDAAAAAAVCGALCAAGAVVADVAGDGPPARAMVARADSILLVCPPALDAARRAARLMEGWRHGPRHDRVGLVVAHRGGAPEIGARALGRTLGAPVVARLPRSGREARSLRAGVWPAGRRARLTRAIAALSEALP